MIMFNSKQKEEIRTLRDLLERSQKEAENYRQQLMKYSEWKRQETPLTASYTLTESDYLNHTSDSARKRIAKQRMALSLVNKIAKSFEPDEMVEDGMLVGYRYVLCVRKFQDNPKLEPEDKNVYEGIWKEGQE